ncbi:MAG: hypothetical protein PF440_07310 [Thiomicrorhabdus sp.]|jgi:hypothetical protein|nr:hypothetical protein [Thiomicrorhabdus sp.]
MENYIRKMLELGGSSELACSERERELIRNEAKELTIVFVKQSRKPKVTLDQNDLASLHDTIFNALDIELKSDDEIMEYWHKLPRDIQLDAEKYGVSDTPTRENIFEFFQNNQ